MRSDEDIIADILCALEEKQPLGRWHLMCMTETTYQQCEAYLNHMAGHNLISVNHEGTSLTDKGKRALQIYRGLTDLIRCK